MIFWILRCSSSGSMLLCFQGYEDRIGSYTLWTVNETCLMFCFVQGEIGPGARHCYLCFLLFFAVVLLS